MIFGTENYHVILSDVASRELFAKQIFIIPACVSSYAEII